MNASHSGESPRVVLEFWVGKGVRSLFGQELPSPGGHGVKKAFPHRNEQFSKY